ncbi:FG-GAP repeat protein [Chondromyces apiculatus]|uniref:Uncharacterized protein n=1 Tax=Chondromyces apiculatus DSM 436 TaxID=1192034 RepID=A0A017SYE4_9BACT|nr:FG-GAP repeat protein [Chondromyces apiculatus]EYF01797.1 Hypothetical protein CAP_7750 [Chondromyces apiculatus DSM 436]
MITGPEELYAQDRRAYSQFGSASAIAGNTLVVGARSALDGTGAAYAFVRGESGWIEEAELLAPDGQVGDDFGFSVAISGDTALVGALFAKEGPRHTGAVYVFSRESGAWVLETRLVGSESAPFGLFGCSVAIDGDTAVVGAFQVHEKTGAAYVFGRVGGTWREQAMLVPEEAKSFDDVGISVAISGDTILVGADTRHEQGEASGAAYVFKREDQVWHQQAKLTASDGKEYRFFGNPVALEGDTAFVGTYLADGAAPGSGAVYVYERTGALWQERTKLSPRDGRSGDAFGISLSTAPGKLVVGSSQVDDQGESSGGGYVFLQTEGEWSEYAKLTAGNGAAGDRVGTSVAIDGNAVVACAPWRDGGFLDTGSAYAFQLDTKLEEGEPCTTAADCRSFECVDGTCGPTGSTPVQGETQDQAHVDEGGDPGSGDAPLSNTSCHQGYGTPSVACTEWFAGGCHAGMVAHTSTESAGLCLLAVIAGCRFFRRRGGRYRLFG